MQRLEQLKELQTIFSSEKKFMGDGYYRIRTLDDNILEMAFLVAGPCGETLVHPQITVSLTPTSAICTKLIDMATSPPKFIYRDSLNSGEMDYALDTLIQQFILVKQKHLRQN